MPAAGRWPDPWAILVAMRRPSPEIPADLRSRLETVRSADPFPSPGSHDSDAGPDPTTAYIRQLLELDADFVEALLGAGSTARENSTQIACCEIPWLHWTIYRWPAPACAAVFPPHAHPILAQLEPSIRLRLSPFEAYNMVPGRDPH